MSEEPITYERLAQRWGVCRRQAKRICKRIGLKPIDLGHRTKRFRPADVDRAEERSTAGGRHKATGNRHKEAAV